MRTTITAAFVCAAILLLFAAMKGGAQPQYLQKSGSGFATVDHGALGEGAGFGAAGREVNLSALPQAQASSVSVSPRLRPLDGLTDEEYAARKASAAQPDAGAVKAHPGPAAPGGGNGESVSADRGFLAQQEIVNGPRPPDMAIAVGQQFVVQFVNSSIAVYDKNGNLQPGFPKSADTFFGLPSGRYTTDPRGFYDWVNNRFVFVMLQETSPFSGTNSGAVMFAASRTSDPRGNWWVYNSNFTAQIGTAGQCPDYPTLGHDSNNWGLHATKGGFYIGINQFSGSGHCSGAGFSTNYVFFVPKDAIYSGAGYGYWYFFGLFANGRTVDTVQPTNVTDRADHPAAIFLVNSYNINFGGGQCSSGCNGLVTWTVSGPTSGSVIAPNNPFAFLQGGNGPILTGIARSTTHNYSLPPNANEPGCANCIDTNDTRISGQVKYHAGSLFGALETGVSGAVATAGPIWFELHPVMSNNNSQLSSVTERQEDCFVCGGWASNGSAYFATLQPDLENNIVMVFGFSSDAAYPGMVYTSRRVTYGDSLMDGVGIYLVSGAAFYGEGRWGDYTATAPDLTTAQKPEMWFAGEYANSSGLWGTAIGGANYVKPSSQ